MALDATSLPVLSVPALEVCSGTRRTGNGGGVSSAPGAEVSVDVPVLWSDEGRMKRELVAWAKAVASMAIRETMRAELTAD
ncbi:hypothetical protein Zm00014a_013372 [Zea mays]|jgi:hypothetical protein|uniref:Uncharacterized protein n=2 Tax=Zea mays TaxID=4577 RepID=A0A1D6E9E4_MAIZE|nr:hypothetical protein ZEAMMB73_Zm00001d003485 [Zea mays]PWZ39147.1 hypothetical protein Zm00014a_013372 [Zea mays]